MKAKLTVVGAGPGDPELITLKAIKALAAADVILYDALASIELLEHCKVDAEKIYVGKRGHQSGISQDSINLLIVEKAYQAGHVVRLKGGDPFVFGRGLEEIEFAKERGLEVAYIPGISSIFGGGNNFIPLTDRRCSDGFWVLTGHKSDKSFADDLQLAVKSNSTLVILMAMSKLDFIVDEFSKEAKTQMPIAIIQHASTAKELKVIGKIGNILKLATEAKITNPAIIIIGEVVNLSLNLQSLVSNLIEENEKEVIKA